MFFEQAHAEFEFSTRLRMSRFSYNSSFATTCFRQNLETCTTEDCPFGWRKTILLTSFTTIDSLLGLLLFCSLLILAWIQDYKNLAYKI